MMFLSGILTPVPVRYSYRVRVAYRTNRGGHGEHFVDVVAPDWDAATQAAFRKIERRRGVRRVYSATMVGRPIQVSGA